MGDQRIAHSLGYQRYSPVCVEEGERVAAATRKASQLQARSLAAVFRQTS